VVGMDRVARMGEDGAVPRIKLPAFGCGRALGGGWQRGLVLRLCFRAKAPPAGAERGRQRGRGGKQPCESCSSASKTNQHQLESGAGRVIASTRSQDGLLDQLRLV
jgi:hypothetical protein